MMVPDACRTFRHSRPRTRKRFTTVFSLCGVIATQTLAQTPEQKPAEPAIAEQTLFGKDSPFNDVAIVDTVLHDPRREKDLNIAVCFPEHAKGPFPVIIFSHGAGGSGRLVTPLPRFWASHGYVVFCPTHADSVSLSRNRNKDEQNKSDPRKAISVALNDPKLWNDRVGDVKFLLDSLDDLGRTVPGLSGKINPARIGVGGHSLGAYTAQLIGGATVEFPGDAKPRSLADDRVQAVLLLSGQGSGQQGLTEHSWDHFARPLLSVTGTNDRGAKGQGHEWKAEPFQHAPPGDKFHIVIEGAHHGSFTGRFAGEEVGANRPGSRRSVIGTRLTDEQKARLRQRFEAGRENLGGDQKAIFGHVKAATLAFWNAYLKADPDARAFLNSDALTTRSQGAVTLLRK